ncbi:cell wall metabolism sensor histidine kinase WalK [Pelagibius sp. Alg239-R121]|uniref:sensor histidine kinase n=1 Tax=Pelagibius sp. Alg239-R121 TaxID=2993448 RepID=UPI0024A64D06|nr:HAMP domain-containing sensor histidine kinase [Pelagibius sp. Alg239-R121]
MIHPLRGFTVKLIALLVFLIALLGVFQVVLTIKTTRLHLMQVDQSLNRELAAHIVQDKWFSSGTDLLGGEFKPIVDRLMSINPTAEIYLLDREGTILRYSAPPEQIKLDKIAIEPIETLIAGKTDLPIVGDDPRDPSSPKAFSTAPIEIDGQLSGYLYVVLGGHAYQSATDMFVGNQILRLSLLIMVVGLGLAIVFGALVSHLLVRRLRRLSDSMIAFADNEFRLAPEPATLASGDEVDALTAAFHGMARRIQEQLSDLEAIDLSRRELIMHISHDLKTPLAGLNGYLETLKMKWEQLDQGERQTYLDSSLALSRQLEQMIADLFELARLNTAEAPLTPETFSMDELVQDVCMRFQFEAKAGEITLDALVAAPGHFVTADIGLVERALTNIIDNAIKFTPTGGSVSVSVSRRDEKVVTKVVDTGVGMPECEHANIFDRFYRIEHGRTETSGTGLGLAIAKRIIELHDGQIDVTSKIKKGTTLSFRLPIALPAPVEQTASPSPL